MKYLKKINENLSNNDSELRDLFTFISDDVSLDINYSSKKHKEIDNLKGSCDIEWNCDFNFFKNKGVEIYPYIKKIYFTFFIDEYIDDNGNTEEIEEEYVLEYDGKNIKIEWNKNDYESVTFMPNSVEFDYDKKIATVYF